MSTHRSNPTESNTSAEPAPGTCFVADDPVLAGVADRYRVGPNSAAWYAIGAARESLARGNPDRAALILDFLDALWVDDLAGTEAGS